MSYSMHKIRQAKLSWQGDTPRSDIFDDVYFSKENGCEEAEYVFLKQNNLPDRWCNVSQFIIGETGFGTGLNFLLTAHRWIHTRSENSHLFYFSIEKFPLDLNDLKNAHSYWPEFSEVSSQLLQTYPGNLPGFHSLKFSKLHITLVLMIGDVREMIPQMQCCADAWFLDGFAPAKNPDMWSVEVMQAIAQKSRVGTRFATFTAAGFVRRNLIAAGFDVEKWPGYGRKREMLCGSLVVNQKRSKKNPWFDFSNITHEKPVQQVAIVGGGLAGLSCAWNLAQHGIYSTIFEASSTLASGASGNLAGIVLPRISLEFDIEGQFYCNEFLSVTAWLDEFKSKYAELNWFKSGVVQIENDRRLRKLKQLKLADEFLQTVVRSDTKDLVGAQLDSDVIYYKHAGYVSPQQLCELLRFDGEQYITVKLNTGIDRVEYKDCQWVLIDKNENTAAQMDKLIIANGYAARQLLKTEIYTVEKNRGQLSYLSATKESRRLNMPVCYQGYIIPAIHDVHCVGATYGGENSSTELTDSDHQQNICAMQNALDLENFGKGEIVNGRASFRTTTLDHLPVAGPVPDELFYRDAYADICHGKTNKTYPHATYLPGLFINVGHGSRGLVSCFSVAQYLTSLITGKPSTYPLELIEKLHPARFLIRDLKKRIQ